MSALLFAPRAVHQPDQRAIGRGPVRHVVCVADRTASRRPIGRDLVRAPDHSAIGLAADRCLLRVVDHPWPFEQSTIQATIEDRRTGRLRVVRRRVERRAIQWAAGPSVVRGYEPPVFRGPPA